MEEIEHVLRNFGLILGAGLVSQLIATVIRLPQMIVLVAAGALIGPSVLGLVSNPLSGLGAQLLFNIGVALILFHRLKLRPKVAQTVIAESAFNDVTGTVLTLTLVGVVEAGGFTFSGPALEFTKELVLGALIGVVAGAVLCYAVASTARAGIWDESPGVAILAVVALAYFSTESLGGSAYLATFVMGLMVGNMELLGLGH